MELYKIASIAKELHEQLQNIETEMCRREWRYSLYYAIVRSVNNERIELRWEAEYSQWNINHLFRSKESAIQRDHPTLTAKINLISEIDDMVHVIGSLEEEGKADEAFTLALGHNHFADLEYAENNGRRILFNNESELILDSLLELDEARVAEDADIPVPGRTNDKVIALTELLGPVRDIYHAQSETGKSFIETVIGASLFYLPHPVNECFSGYCSIAALNEKINGRRIVKEHITPRKYAAREILDNAYELNGFFNDFTGRFRRFMYLTSEENRRTVNYADATHDEALANLGIERFPAGESPFVNNHTLFMNFIAFCRERIPADQELDIETATAMLAGFTAHIRN